MKDHDHNPDPAEDAAPRIISQEEAENSPPAGR
jgi:hypothetical protein